MLLQIKNLNVNYGQVPAVKNVNLTLEKGEILAIVGESGSGKTTVIRTIMGCLPPNSHVANGEILFNGQELLAFSPRQWRAWRGKEMSMIFQDCGNMINPVRSIGQQYIDYIRVHAPELTADKAYAKAVVMLTAMRLSNADNIMHSYPFELSGGMRQRVGIAMAMTFHPQLLLADEPTSALDVTTQAQIVRQMVDLRKESGVSIIIVTHNLGVAAYMADQIVVMQQGQIDESGKAATLIERPQHEYTKQLLKAVPRIGGERFV